MARSRSQTPFTDSRSADHHALTIVLKGLIAAPPHNPKRAANVPQLWANMDRYEHLWAL